MQPNLSATMKPEVTIMNIETAKRLYEYRKANGYSQEELAAKIGVSRQAISKWERSESSPDTDNLIALAQLYGVSLDTLLMGEEEPKNANMNSAEASGTAESSNPESAEPGAQAQADTAEPNEPEAENSEDAGKAETPDPAGYNNGSADSAGNGAQQGYNNYSTQYYYPANKEKKKMSKGTKIAIGAIVAVVLIIIAAAVGLNIYDEIYDDRLEAQRETQMQTDTTTTEPGQSQSASGSGAADANSISASSVSKISVEWAAGSVNISYYDGTDIQFDDGLDAADDNALFSRTEGSELKIYYNRNARNTQNSNEKTLQINIPAGTALTEFDIETASADINVNGIIADQIELHSVSGDINATGEFASLDIETTSGNAQVTDTAALIRQIDANAVSGNITVTIPQSIDGFYMEYETVSGEINNDFGAAINGSSRRGTANYGNGSANIEVETVSGNFSLKSAQ